jgi:hypothetical protein
VYPRNVTEFCYRYADASTRATVLMGVELDGSSNALQEVGAAAVGSRV